MPENKMEIKSETNIVCDELDQNDLQRDLVSIKVERNHNGSVLNVPEFQRESSNIGGDVVAEDERENSITDTKENLPSIANEEEDIKNKDSNFAMETKEFNCYSPCINTAKNATLIDDISDIKPNVQKPSSSNLVKQSQVLGNKKMTSHAQALNKETKDSRTNGITKLSAHDTEMTGQAVNDSKCTMCYKSIQCKHTTTDGKNSSKKFQCDVCGNWFKHTYTLRKHKCNHEGEYSCSVCNKRYGLPSYLKRHMRIHTDEKTFYKCRYCDKSLCSTSSLAAHERLHTLDKPFECDVCHKRFTQSSNLTTHKKVHSEYRPYVCELCSKPFRHKQSLLVHLRSHTHERPYTCGTCGQTFTQNTHMRTHERLHSGVKPYKCDMCEKTFSRKHHLGYHLETHSGKTYKCSICEKSFTAERAVIQHERIHTGDTPYKCDVCGKEFKYHGYLSVHKRIHTGDMPFRCKFCPKEFIVASSLQQHLKHNHRNKRKRPGSIITSPSDDINGSTNQSITGSCTNNSEVQEANDNGLIESVELACDSAKKRPVTQSVIGQNEKKKSANKKQDASNKNISVKRRNKRTA
ncbi:zinc finger protein ZFP2-like [Mytilus californianus]|uniref:zinc finger protein ZFP2-like n=1 Tax=Mytilus californianus TaxID=6549 RepID=UPI0022458E16|nr:zinc finger protein ZFP2-like [Mytilus californianus]